ncbi:hypothetical protein [Streptomyces colonosanans]|uniref:Uncharacterized protein n=1 Tax=Streptomyces colonosanans TaxID=1428652 RepID=A0A1S2PR69_9ACTN|nr:hypothetical protein [Streptomyces colonosanans]OIJ95424.1 hypothetical protein BIV24_09080 [Streptomyces colonosanans]
MTVSTSTTARTIGADVLDNLSIVGGVVAGTAVGRFAHARTTERHGPVSRLAAGVAAGLAAATITDSLLAAATGSWRRTLRGTAPAAPATSLDQARLRVAAQAAADAAHKAKSRWHWRDLRNPTPSDDLWHGYEDGTALYYLSPGLYLRYQPDHRDLGTKFSEGWTEQYTLETGQGTTVLTGPAQLLELLNSLQEEAADSAADVLAGEPSESLAVVDAALTEQPEDDQEASAAAQPAEDDPGTAAVTVLAG